MVYLSGVSITMSRPNAAASFQQSITTERVARRFVTAAGVDAFAKAKLKEQKGVVAKFTDMGDELETKLRAVYQEHGPGPVADAAFKPLRDEIKKAIDEAVKEASRHIIETMRYVKKLGLPDADWLNKVDHVRELRELAKAKKADAGSTSYMGLLALPGVLGSIIDAGFEPAHALAARKI